MLPRPELKTKGAKMKVHGQPAASLKTEFHHSHHSNSRIEVEIQGSGLCMNVERGLPSCHGVRRAPRSGDTAWWTESTPLNEQRGGQPSRNLSNTKVQQTVELCIIQVVQAKISQLLDAECVGAAKTGYSVVICHV